MEGVDQFEPECFGISPREAANMDPQQRLLLETAWEGLADAGLPTDRLANTATGVFVGISTWDYANLQSSTIDRRSINAFSALGTNLSIAANRLSYSLDLRGPSLAVDTACSSSLVAVDRALRSLWSGECEMAIAGGVNVILTVEPYIAFCAASMLSQDGRCKAFDARADGFVRAEGAGVILLKPLSQACQDGDSVHAVILSSGVNQDGRSSSIAVPNDQAQRDLLRQVYLQASIDPISIGYVEAHGPGTAVGDPIEADVLGSFFSTMRPKDNPLWIGSVKTNIGHLEAASGIAGLIKLILCVKHRKIPANLHFDTPNPEIDFDLLNLKVPTGLLPWPERCCPAIGGVNSFGFGGTNAHVVVSEYLSEAPLDHYAGDSCQDDAIHLLPITARSDRALNELAQSFCDFLSEDGPSQPALTDICFSASQRRTFYDHRLTLFAKSREEAKNELVSFLSGEVAPGMSIGEKKHALPRTAFVFSGQGTQWWAMGRQLLSQEPAFRHVVDTCDQVIQGCGAPWSLLEELNRGQSESRIDQTAIAQPAIFAIQAGLLEFWKSLGVVPDAVVGHSVGEVAAAYSAGVYSLEEAAQLAFYRGRAMGQAHAGGKMLAVQLGEEEARRLQLDYKDQVSLAAVNGPSSVTFSGQADAIETIARRLESQNTSVKSLIVSHAFHSAKMDPARDELLESLAGLSPATPAFPLVSTVTGEPLGDLKMDGHYWWRNVRQGVRFYSAIQWLVRRDYGIFLEIGPHPALLPSILDCAREQGQQITVLPSLRRDEDERRTLFNSAGQLFAIGKDIHWSELVSGGRYISLPRHPWNREICWQENTYIELHRRITTSHPLLGQPLPSACPTWHQALDLKAFPYLRDHRVDGKTVLPAAAYIELALAIAGHFDSGEACCLEQVNFQKAMFLAEGSVPTVETTMDHAGQVQIRSRLNNNGSHWVQHFTTSARPIDDSTGKPSDLDEIKRSFKIEISVPQLYRAFAEAGLDFGPAFRPIQTVWVAEGQALGKVLGTEIAVDRRYRFHPLLLDGCLQVLGAANPTPKGALYLPERIGRVRYYGPAQGEVWVHARSTQSNSLMVVGDLDIYDETGRLLMAIEGLCCRQIPRARREDRKPTNCLYEVEWQESEPVASKPNGKDQESGTGLEEGSKQSWLILADADGVADQLREWFRSQGIGCTLVNPGEGFKILGQDSYQTSTGSQQELQALIEACEERGGLPASGIVFLSGLDVKTTAETSVQSLRQDEARICHGLMYLVQALENSRSAASLALTIVTRGARQVTGQDQPASPLQSALLGLGRVICNELPRFRVKLIDLDPHPHSRSHEQLFSEIVWGTGEQEVAWRKDQRWVPRLERAKPVQVAVNASTLGQRNPIRLEVTQRGVIDSLTWREVEPKLVPRRSVRIAVRYSALNFRDVLKVLGLYPAEKQEELLLGDECAGTVVAVGKGVRNLQVGDRVLAVSQGCLCSSVTVPERQVMPIPEELSMEQGVTLPIAGLTATYALHHLAKIKPRDRILIHSATGGVGLAALQIAMKAGAEIYATAGTDDKRRLLIEKGVKKSMDSRSLSFAEEILRETSGSGVDIVLNSLAGEAMVQSLSCLASHGRFLELGKRDFYEDRRIGLWPFRKNISFFSIDLSTVLFEKTSVGVSLWKKLSKLLREKSLTPLPHTTFPASKISEVFRLMGKGEHVGKLVIDLEDPKLLAERLDRPLSFSADATYLIVGGFGGFGLACANWMVAKGARHLVLMGRKGAHTEESRTQVENLRKAGAEVYTSSCDVADSKRLGEELSNIAVRMPPLRGVFHAAMVLDDGMLIDLTADRFTQVTQPKLQGAWNLHDLTQKDDLDHFVLFSSISASIGNHGQASYAAANSFLEGLAAYRQSLGLAGKAIAWGLLDRVGYAAGKRGLIRSAERRGLLTMTPEDCFEALEPALSRRASTTVVGRFDWQKIAQAFGNGHSTAGLLSSLAASSPEAENAGRGRLWAELKGCSPEERPRKAEEYLRAHIARILGTSNRKLNPRRSLRELGFDSLMWVELITIIERDLYIVLPSGTLGPDAAVQDLVEVFLKTAETEPPEEKFSGRQTPPKMTQLFETCRVIPLREGGEQVPLFLVHPLGVHEGVYRPLVEALTPMQPIYGIQSSLFDGEEEGGDLDRMTVDLVDAMLEVRPQGPYKLCGYSLGGHLALKMAKVLEDLGKDVSFVGVIEWELDLALGRWNHRQAVNLLVSLYQLLEKRFGVLAPMPLDQLTREATQIAEIIVTDNKGHEEVVREWLETNQYREAKQYIDNRTSPEVLGGYLKQLIINYWLLERDTPPKPIQGPLFVWRARNGLGSGQHTWNEMTNGELCEEQVEGDHFSLVIPPHVSNLAKRIDRRLLSLDPSNSIPESGMELSRG